MLATLVLVVLLSLLNVGKINLLII